MGKRHRTNEYAGIVQKLQQKGVPQERNVTIYKDGSSVDKINEKKAVRTFAIMIGVPMDEVVFSQFFLLFMRNVNPMPWDGLSTTLSTYLPEARNKIHNEFLDSKMYNWLFMLDSDVLVPPHTVERLMAHNLPFVSGFYKSKSEIKKNTPVVYDFVKEDDNGLIHWTHRDEAGKGLERVDGVGMGCALMTREAAEKLGRNPYDMNGSGEDLVICRKLAKLGVPIHVDWSVDCAHLGVAWH